jgi:hypothetical protein
MYELRASDNRVSGLAAEQAIEGAARYVNYVACRITRPTARCRPQHGVQACEAVPIGDAKFWIIGRDPSASQSNRAVRSA